MRRITVSLPDELAEALAIEARRLHRPMSDIVREAVMKHVGLGSAGERRELPFANLGASGHSDTSLQVDSLLADAWANESGLSQRR